MKQINFHTASCAEIPHVVVYTEIPIKGMDEMEQDEVLANFYITEGNISEAEDHALAYMKWLVDTKRFKFDWNWS